ncbi:ribosomal-protein-L7/L12-serine acetyltransferase [Cedecea davisae]|uniref:Acetyltransferase, GNAT family n=1 Tax=Cedecea davisae DSM 4568 TaxID=566551 RepID=S3JV20_9ENTR|nr:GNAT family N-acetyltransferase [Cedecea davisae]EPF16994.1 acetyltransferase, GNAT family [Cedecea davisae DSM 4568]STA45164.1 ribosomal-protein-L7/L12-serine acetyltransferase [Cedecea davisae]
MSFTVNSFQQPIGFSLPDWQRRPLPERVTLNGQYCRLEPLSADKHGAQLWQAWSQAEDQRGWTYLSVGPFETEADFMGYIAGAEKSADPFHFSVVDNASGQAMGTLSLMRIDPANGSIEVGFVVFSPLLQRTVQATEAHYLLMKYAFETLGYRRYEWKCDSLNGPSRRAALRLGFRFEGVFRQMSIYKGRTRDTAWFSITDGEWPLVKSAFERWLSASNIVGGVQQQGLAAIRTELSGGNTELNPSLNVRLLNHGDREQWLALWQDYLTFYDAQISDEVTALTWRRMLDDKEPMWALGAFDGQGRLLGFTHFLYHRSTWSETHYCYLEDLFSAPQARGKGVGRALIEAVRQHAEANNSGRLYWHTHETNATAQTLYDKVAAKSGFIQYQKEV